MARSITIALDYLRQYPESMLYRGDKTETWMLQGAGSPSVTFTRGEIERAVKSGLLVPKFPEEPKLGIDCLQAAPAGA